jgi:hypothetical protein
MWEENTAKKGLVLAVAAWPQGKLPGHLAVRVPPAHLLRRSGKRVRLQDQLENSNSGPGPGKQSRETHLGVTSGGENSFYRVESRQLFQRASTDPTQSHQYCTMRPFWWALSKQLGSDSNPRSSLVLALCSCDKLREMLKLVKVLRSDSIRLRKQQLE